MVEERGPPVAPGGGCWPGSRGGLARSRHPMQLVMPPCLAFSGCPKLEVVTIQEAVSY